MARDERNRWSEAAWQLPTSDFQFHLPYPVLLGEALDLARFAKKYWKNTEDKNGRERLGLESAQPRRKGTDLQPVLNVHTADEIMALASEVENAQGEYLRSRSPGVSDEDVERAQFLLSEMSGALEYLFDDGVEDERDAQLARVVQTHKDDPASIDALAGELQDYAGLANEYRDELDGLGGFKTAYIDEGSELVRRLRE